MVHLPILTTNIALEGPVDQRSCALAIKLGPEEDILYSGREFVDTIASGLHLVRAHAKWREGWEDGRGVVSGQQRDEGIALDVVMTFAAVALTLLGLETLGLEIKQYLPHDV